MPYGQLCIVIRAWAPVHHANLVRNGSIGLKIFNTITTWYQKTDNLEVPWPQPTWLPEVGPEHDAQQPERAHGGGAQQHQLTVGWRSLSNNRGGLTVGGATFLLQYLFCCNIPSATFLLQYFFCWVHIVCCPDWVQRLPMQFTNTIQFYNQYITQS